ncbi:MAG: hypothetical protein QGH40_10800, partial [bacterium]|nr:hypothetical protein [bacterium]
MVKKDLITALRPAGFVVAGLACLCLLACGQGVYGANMSLNGICYATISIEDQNGVTDVFDYVPENLDVRVMSIDIGTGSFIDYTDLTQPHDTYRDINGVGYYRVQAKPDLTFTQGVKEGFSTNEQIHLFIY